MTLGVPCAIISFQGEGTVRHMEDFPHQLIPIYLESMPTISCSPWHLMETYYHFFSHFLISIFAAFSLFSFSSDTCRSDTCCLLKALNMPCVRWEVDSHVSILNVRQTFITNNIRYMFCFSAYTNPSIIQ